MEESTSLCSNCQRPIAASNFVTHTVHCQRNLIKCEKCGEAIPRLSVEEHEAEFHATIDCPDCGVSVEKPVLENHRKNDCHSRQQGCPYCELELPANEIYEHKNYCGSRTKKCEECGEYVMLKYEELHLDSNHTFLKLDDEPGPTATWIKNDLDLGSPRAVKSNNNKKPQLYTGKFVNYDEDDVDDLPSLFANLMKQKKVVAAEPLYQSLSGPSDDTDDLVALPCEFCQAMIPVNQLILHQTGCRVDITSFGKRTTNVEKSKLESNGSEQDNDIDIIGDRLNFQRNALDDVLEWRREENAELFDVRRNAIDEGTVDVRRNDLSETVYDTFKNSGGGNESEPKQDWEDPGVYLPCEFCGEGYPPNLLLEHQDVCEYHPTNAATAPGWLDSQDGGAGRSKALLDVLRARKFDVKDSDQHYSNGTRGKSNIDSYNDLRGNFTVASEWSDDGDSRPMSATGAIPKQKAGKLNLPRKVNQEVQSSRSSNTVRPSSSRPASNQTRRIRIRNNLRDEDDEDDED